LQLNKIAEKNRKVFFLENSFNKIINKIIDTEPKKKEKYLNVSGE
tara:strand:- start:328 stop:462 length:135 start_codon:yes stop_codon:yes gene_type:complete